MSSQPRFKRRNPRIKKKKEYEENFVNNKPYIRDRHRDPDFEKSEDLIDAKYRLKTDIDKLRSENEKMKKEIRKKEEQWVMNEESKIAVKGKCTISDNEAFQIRRLITFMKQYDDLNVLSTELDSQYEFLVRYYSEAAQVELAETSGMQSHKLHEFAEEINEMEKVKNKAIARLNGPVERQKRLFFDQEKRIEQLRAELKELRNLEYAVESNAYYHHVEWEVLPEELEVIVEDLKHKLEIEKHRKFLRQKELEAAKKRYQEQRNALIAARSIKAKAAQEEIERSRFRNRMQKVRKQKEEQKHRLYEARRFKCGEIVLLSEDSDEEYQNGDEKWSPLTFAKEAHD